MTELFHFHVLRPNTTSLEDFSFLKEKAYYYRYVSFFVEQDRVTKVGKAIQAMRRIEICVSGSGQEVANCI